MSEYSLDDYRNAPSGEGPLAYEKPRRLVYDLIKRAGDAERVIAELTAQLEAARHVGGILAGGYTDLEPCGHAKNFLIGDEHGEFTCTVCRIAELTLKLDDAVAGNIRLVHEREDALFALARMREAVEQIAAKTCGSDCADRVKVPSKRCAKCIADEALSSPPEPAPVRIDPDYARLNRERGELIKKSLSSSCHLTAEEKARLQYLTGYAEAHIAIAAPREEGLAEAVRDVVEEWKEICDLSARPDGPMKSPLADALDALAAAWRVNK